MPVPDPELELARQQWADGDRRVDAARGEPSRHALLLEQVDVVVGGLRERVGQVFTLTELARAYEGADDWVRSLLDDAGPEAPPATGPGTIADAAFHLYARGASDYRP